MPIYVVQVTDLNGDNPTTATRLVFAGCELGQAVEVAKQEAERSRQQVQADLLDDIEDEEPEVRVEGLSIPMDWEEKQGLKGSYSVATDDLGFYTISVYEVPSVVPSKKEKSDDRD